MNTPLIHQLKKAGSAICRLPGDKQLWGVFCNPDKILTTNLLSEIPYIFNKLEKFLSQGGFAAGFVSYEAAPAFEPAISTLDSDDFPLVYFCLYPEAPEVIDLTQQYSVYSELEFSPDIDFAEYNRVFKRIKQDIIDGNTYQVNYTCRLKSGTLTEPELFFFWLFQHHPMPYSAYFNTGNFQILSLSPELFLQKTGTRIISIPMKGTAHRKLSAEDDSDTAKELGIDVKNIAENLMIVDMVRNDFGRICFPGSIYVNPIFKVETYQTVHQMVSVVHGELAQGKGIMDVFRATFPPASITGAPKISAVEIIKREETSPRKIYTGTIGCFTADGDYCLNVAIRTLISGSNGTELGVGSGIVVDSNVESEWQEILVKSRFVNFLLPDFKIIETMLWRRESGFEFLKEHLDRASVSMKYFGWKYKSNEVNKVINIIEQQLIETASDFFRVRLILDCKCVVSFQIFPLVHYGWNGSGVRLMISSYRVNSQDLFLYHKTNKRDFYDSQYQECISAGFDEVIFFNESGTLTEGAISNIFIKYNGAWLTSPVAAGLLPGIWRNKMLKELGAVETSILIEQLRLADEIIIGNSVRGGAVVTNIDFSRINPS